MPNGSALAPQGTKAEVLARSHALEAVLPGGAQFAMLMLDSTETSNLAGLGTDTLARHVGEAIAFLSDKPDRAPRIRLRQLGPAITDGATAADLALSVLEIVNDDMPFLVDSVMGEVHAAGHDVRLVLHPIFKSRRSSDGRLEAIAAAGDRNWSDGRQESYISVHMARLGQAAADKLVANITQILSEVRTAVTDWQPMLARVEKAIAALSNPPASLPADVVAECVAFLSWLKDGQFTFLGLRELRLEGGAETGDLAPVEGTGLGLLRDPSIQVLRRGGELVAMTPEIRRFYFAATPLIITKSNVVARVHRRAYMDYIGVKTYAADGTLAGELRIVGLFTSQAYTHSPRDIPLLRRKVARVQAALGYPPASHAGKALLNVLDTFPRDELFQIGADQLQDWTRGILDLELRPRVRLFARVDRFDRFVSALVHVPRDRYSTSTREAIGKLLAEAYKGHVSAYYPSFPEGSLARVQFIIGRRDGTTPQVDVAALEQRLAEVTRSWSDRLVAAVQAANSEGEVLVAKYRDAFSAGYAEAFEPARGIEDIKRIEQLGPDRPVAIDFYRLTGANLARVRTTISRFDQPISLTERVPVLENLGFNVIEERSWRVTPRFGEATREVALHDMWLETVDGAPLDLGQLDERLEDCVLAVLRGDADNDGFNRLVTLAGADWREAAMLRAYGAYLRQLGAPFGLRYLAEVLGRHAGVARDLIELFHARFDPDLALGEDARTANDAAMLARIDGALAQIQSADEDRILRHYLDVLKATTRTNFFQRDVRGHHPETIAFKLAGRDVESAPAPRSYAEIFVYSPRVEGIHLRFAPIARGGIRWSDRAQDFRTEVLGLCKAQQVKNAVIVPAGAKGGFVPKRMPRNATRDVMQREGEATYRIFIAALLDITDNIVDGKLVPPARVLRRDGDDPYLVVAADKGTATFSDIANAISLAHGHWLGDAFASGGSAGYDHKKMAITSRGVWECVKRHFREMDRDIQREPFTAVGVGDMSGDVFGNGMLMSPATRLIAAFDHRDIFIDPSPDPVVGLAERRRLFDLPRSSWADYDRSRISQGGGVFSRNLKTIALSDEVRRLLGIEAASLPPADLMRAILQAEVDLLYFGGIGTYIRAASETDAEAGDRANDGLRITGGQVRAKVIGEGANLGMTQRGRVEAAQKGVRLDTDFIHNSAGVNTSDQEVNIKIALAPATAAGGLSADARKVLLVSVTDHVAAGSLRNNIQQSLALSLAERRAPADIGYHGQLIRNLVARGTLDRRLEALPTDLQIAERQRAGRGLVRPEIAVLLSYAKIALLHDLLGSQVPDDPAVAGLLADYFPPAIREAHAEGIAAHRVKREIIATALTNAIVNRLGPATPVRLAEETGRAITDVAYAYMAVRDSLALPELWRRIDALDGRIAGQAQLDLYARVQDIVIDKTAAFLRSGAAAADLAGFIARNRAAIAELAAMRDGAASTPGDQTPVAAGLPADLAADMARLAVLAEGAAIADIATAARSTIPQAARVYFAVGDAFHLDTLKARARAIATSDHYDRLAIASAEATLAAARRDMTRGILAAANGHAPDVAAWREKLGARAERIEASLKDATSAGDLGISRLTVAATQLRELAGG